MKQIDETLIRVLLSGAIEHKRALEPASSESWDAYGPLAEAVRMVSAALGEPEVTAGSKRSDVREILNAIAELEYMLYLAKRDINEDKSMSWIEASWSRVQERAGLVATRIKLVGLQRFMAANNISASYAETKIRREAEKEKRELEDRAIEHHAKHGNEYP
jgi:hypothetical protein